MGEPREAQLLQIGRKLLRRNGVANRLTHLSTVIGFVKHNRWNTVGCSYA